MPYARYRAAVAADGPLWVVPGDSMAQGLGAGAPQRRWAGLLAADHFHPHDRDYEGMAAIMAEALGRHGLA
ncbi:hypothetical protein [Pseudonocardia xishanensis]|uniref:GDSL-like lipase/acylhydrolase family protein n=1 Tax=Pseudonocardia xishanensis TaxID=630995 RepID=A0ABP8RSH7_9PSEU